MTHAITGLNPENQQEGHLEEKPLTRPISQLKQIGYGISDELRYGIGIPLKNQFKEHPFRSSLIAYAIALNMMAGAILHYQGTQYQKSFQEHEQVQPVHKDGLEYRLTFDH